MWSSLALLQTWSWSFILPPIGLGWPRHSSNLAPPTMHCLTSPGSQEEESTGQRPQSPDAHTISSEGGQGSGPGRGAQGALSSLTMSRSSCFSSPLLHPLPFGRTSTLVSCQLLVMWSHLTDWTPLTGLWNGESAHDFI